MGVLNFAHGAFLTIARVHRLGGAGAGLRRHVGGSSRSPRSSAILVGAAVAALTECVLIRRLYERHIEQALVTVGLSLAAVALFEGIWGTDPIYTDRPAWLKQTTEILGARIPNDRFLLIACAVLVLGGIVLFLQKTRYGLIIRAGVENRSMVTALGIDVRRAFTLVFAIGGAAAGIGGVLASHYGYVSAHSARNAAHLRVHRDRHRRAGLAHRARRSPRCSSPCCSSSRTSTSAARAT